MPEENPVRGLHNLVVQRLGTSIASGELPADSQVLPDELADRFSTSRPVVREALRVLEAKGMVRPRPKTGTRVLGIEHWNLLDQDVIGWRVLGPDRSRQLLELTDLRIAVESIAARQCASHASASQLTLLHRACDDMERARAAGDLSGFTSADITFHTTILEASGNAMFGHFASPFAAFLHAREDLRTLPEQVNETVIEDHRKILVAIDENNGDAAEALSRALIEKARTELERNLGGASEPGAASEATA